MYFDSIKTISLHDAFKICYGVFIRRIGISNPPIEIANSTVWATSSAWCIVSNEINPFVHISPIDPSIAGANTVFFTQICSERTTCFHDQGNDIASCRISCNKPRPLPACILIVNSLYRRALTRVIQPRHPGLIGFSNRPINTTNLSKEEDNLFISWREEDVHAHFIARFHIQNGSILSAH